MASPTAPIALVPDSAEILAQLSAGDELAFAAVFRSWYAPLVRFAARVIGDRARAEEVVQDTLLQLWRRRASLDPSGTVQAWLFHAVRNRALNVIRHDGIIARTEPKLVTAHRRRHDQNERSDADIALAEAELHLAIDAAVGALPPRCREVFILSRRHGLRQTQIAARLGISLKAVEANMTRALRAALLPLVAAETRLRST